ncbi:MAG: hypothetical protein NC483_05710 [Ruminococcus sp.]|nr:hypothetical protein [Ruminococcus sp.]
MKFERNSNGKKYFLCGLILVVVLTITINFITSKANYRMTASIPLTEGKVTASPYDINIVALYLDNVEQDSNTIIPSGYKINEDTSYCYKGTNKNNKDSNARVYTDELGNHSFSGLSKASKCVLYLDKNTENAKTMSELLNTHYKYKSKRTAENKDFNVPYGETTYGMIFEAEDDDGTTYYFAGNPLDNWVEFGDYYWRIIRINGDGSIRMIYQGKTINGARVTGEYTNIIKAKFNYPYNDNRFVGYWYGEEKILRGLTYPSSAYTALNDWFKNSYIKQGTSYFNKIDLNAGFCGDREPSTSYIDTNGNGGIGTENTYYAASIRLWPNKINVTEESATVEPSYNCINKSDLYSFKGNEIYPSATQGNNVLENPVGLVTADEVNFAGLIYGGSGMNNNYLYTNQEYWTMSPFLFDANHKYAQMFSVSSSGKLNMNVNATIGIRPVINLRSDVTFTGNGTQSNPYKVVV